MISIPCTISDQQASVQHQTRNLSYTARRLRVLGRPGPRPGSSRIWHLSYVSSWERPAVQRTENCGYSDIDKIWGHWESHVSTLRAAGLPLPDHPPLLPGHQEVAWLQVRLEADGLPATRDSPHHLAQSWQSERGPCRPPAPVSSRHQPLLPLTPVSDVPHLETGVTTNTSSEPHLKLSVEQEGGHVVVVIFTKSDHWGYSTEARCQEAGDKEEQGDLHVVSRVSRTDRWGMCGI